MKCHIMWHFIRVCTIAAEIKETTEKEKQYYLEIVTREPSLHTMNHPDLSVSIFMESPLLYKELTTSLDRMIRYIDSV